MIPEREADVAGLAQADLVSQYREKPKLAALLTSRAVRIDVVRVVPSHPYSVTVDGTLYTYHSKPTDTGADIAEGLFASFVGNDGIEGFGLGEDGLDPFGGGA